MPRIIVGGRWLLAAVTVDSKGLVAVGCRLFRVPFSFRDEELRAEVGVVQQKKQIELEAGVITLSTKVGATGNEMSEDWKVRDGCLAAAHPIHQTRINPTGVPSAGGQEPE